MQGIMRRIVYVSSFELIGMSISAVMLAYLSGTETSHTGPLALMITTTAVTVNLIYNSLFERWEASQKARTRTLGRRVFHALGFQFTLVLFLIPLIAWWMNISLWDALVLDASLIVFFPIYTFVFNWGFDLVFGLPASVTGGQQQPAAAG